MTTVEKLLVQIFERKNSIIEQVKQQAELYSQHLASKLLIDGITPPSWLWNPDNSYPQELNKEELISKLLRPYPQPSARCSLANYPGYNNLVITGDDEEFSDRVFVENPAPDKGVNRQDDPIVPVFITDDHVGCALNSAPELDFSITSPEDQTNERISSIYNAPDQSLAGIQRSKSRQKALELRSSAKALAKSGLGCENISNVVSSQIRFSLSATDQAGQNDELAQLAEPCALNGQSCPDRDLDEAEQMSREMRMDAYSERITRSRSCTEVPIAVKGSFTLGSSAENCKESAFSHVSKARKTESMPISNSKHADNYVKLPRSAGPSAVCCKSCEDRRIDDADFVSEDKDTNVYAGKITRSRISGKRPGCCCDSSKADSSSDNYQGIDIAMMNSANDLAPMCVDGSLVKLVSLSNVHRESCNARESISEDFERHKERDTCPSSGSIQHNARIDEVSDLEVSSLSAKVDGGILAPSDINDEQLGATFVSSLTMKESRNSQGCSIEEIRTSLSSSQIRFSLSATDQAGQNDELPQLAEPCAHNGQSCLDRDLDEADRMSREMRMDAYSERITRSGSCTKVPTSVKGSFTLGCPVDDCKENALCHVSKARRTVSMPISNSEHADNYVKLPKSAGPATVSCKSCEDRRVDDADFLSKDKDTNVYTGKITRSRISRKRQGCCFDSSKADSSSDNYQRIDIAMMDSANDLAPDSVDRSLVKVVSLPNVHHESCNARESLSEDFKRHKERDTFPFCGSIQHNACMDEVSDLEVSSLSAKVDGGILAPFDINDEQLGATLISSLTMKESRDSQGCFTEEVRTSLSSSNIFDWRLSGNEQCSEHLCNLEKNADNLNSEDLKISNTLLEGIQSPMLEDGLNTQHSVLSPCNEDVQLTDVDQSMPAFEGFIVDAQADIGQLNFAADGFDFDELNLPKTTLERASILAEICRSASLDKPSSQFSSAFEFQETQNLFQSVPNGGHFQHLDLGDTFPLNSDIGNHLQSDSSSSDDCKDTINGMPYSVSISYSGARYGWNPRYQHASPVGKLWDRLSSQTGSSEKRLSSNPELTCFPIEEDPSVIEENKIVDENAGDVQEEVDSSLANHCDRRQPLKDMTNFSLSRPVSAEEETLNIDSVDFVSTKFSVTGVQEKVQWGPECRYRNNSETSKKQTSSTGTTDVRRNQPSSIGAKGIKKAKESMNSSISKSIVSNKTSLKGQNQKVSLKKSTRNNIVSNVSSFIPLIQQKQAATACAGKRDVKVKALEAAENAKRLEDKKEIERKLRKEALKLERAKLEEKNLRQMELEKKKREEERKKKDADIIAKKRLREEEERKEKEKKRMRLEVRQRQREQEEKKRAEKAEKENQQSKDEQTNSKKEFDNEPKKQQNRETTRGDGVALQKAGTKLTVTGVVMNHEECGTSALSCEAEKAMHTVDRSPRNEDLIAQNRQGKSYEISPYQCSDDEDEEDDELPTKKYIPSWASKSSVAMFLPLQQKLDPDVIFPPESFCSMDEVLLPRKLQQSRVAV